MGQQVVERKREYKEMGELGKIERKGIQDHFLSGQAMLKVTDKVTLDIKVVRYINL